MGNEPQKGVVTVLDILRVHKPEREEVNVAEKIDGVVAHFIAHNKVTERERLRSHSNVYQRGVP